MSDVLNAAANGDRLPVICAARPCQSVDVVVIGAGIIGASCAFRLAERGLRVTVLESRSAPAEGSTGRSLASVRTQWSDPLNVELAWRGIQAYRDFEKDHGLSSGYRPTGYMFLVPAAGWDDQREIVDMQRRIGAPVHALSFDDAQLKTPFQTDGLGGVTFGPADGVVDPVGVTTAYLSMGRRLGVSVHLKTPVTGIEQSAGAWVVETPAGHIETTFIVNAAGGWAGEVGRLANLDVPVRHQRMSVFSTAPLAEERAHPLTIDIATGAYLRSEGNRVLFGAPDHAQTFGYDVSVDWASLEHVLEVECARFPWLADQPLDRKGAWAGTVEVTPDHSPILGRMDAAPTWVNACGFSGHGVMQAPMIGQLVAEELFDGDVSTLNIDQFRLSRFDTAVSTLRDGH